MKTTITLTAEQLALLLQVFDSAISQFEIEPSEQNLADEVLDILETAENKITSLY